MRNGRWIALANLIFKKEHGHDDGHAVDSGGKEQALCKLDRHGDLGQA
jgi:hypothetical protein